MLETRTIHAIKQAGGQITRDQGMIQAVFDENSFGFWLDMLMFIESMKQITDDTSGELYGYALLLGINNPSRPESLCRIMAGGPEGGGVFMDQAVAAAMQPYIIVETRERWEPKTAAIGKMAYARLKEIKIIVPSARNNLPLGKTAASSNGPEQFSSILYLGRALKGRRTEIYFHGASINPGNDKNEIIPLFVRFGGGGLCAITDAFAQWMRSLPGMTPGEKEKQITGAWEFLFRERLRERPSPYAVRRAREFFGLLLGFYCDMAGKAGKSPVVILENIHIAENEAAQIVIETLRTRQDINLVGICPVEAGEVSLSHWKPLFNGFVNCNADSEAVSPSQYAGLPVDLWELGYVCSLFGTYFPPEFIPQLLEESGKNAAMISRTIVLMHTLKIIDTTLDPRPWNERFMEQAEIALGEKKETLRALVSGRLLAWVEQKKINPCVSLLIILEKLGASEKIDDNMILQSIHNELSAANGAELRNALDTGIFRKVAGQEREPAIRHITETLLALHYGGVEMIRGVFAVQSSECVAYPLFQARNQTSLSLYALGLRGNEQALESAKKSVIICQKYGGPCLAMSYRLMALASLSQKRINETVNYLGFALENAVLSGEPQEIGMSNYYAACVQLLYGNLSLSRKYAEKASRHFLEAGNLRWSDRSRFLEGRIAFESGYYRQASDIFENLLKNPNGENNAEKQKLIEAWVYRANTNGYACGQTPSSEAPADMGCDVGLFQLEALYIKGEYAKMEELSELLSGIPANDVFIHIEQPDWRSGFSQCELLYFSWSNLWERMLDTLRSLAQCRLSPQKAEKAQTTMQQTLKKSQFPEIDTWDPFYYYALFQTLKHSGASQVDISTAASAAFNRLQNRSGKIDDPDTRQQYLKQPYWSKALWQAALEFKLV
jgi:tetratricopeptide (TPR) repeat protein